jgi:hypothetical protein
MPVADEIRAAAGGGQPLDGATQGRLAAGLDADLSGVRVHADDRADRLARGVEAVAFTSGRDIFFRQGTYNPSSQDGLRLVAHEVAHTVQQAAGPVAGTPTSGGISISDPADPFERAATGFADRFITGEPASPAEQIAPVQAQALPQVMRQPGPPGTPIPITTLSKVDEAAETIHSAINPVQGADYRPQREAVLREILLHHGVASELKSTYQAKYNRDLVDHVQEVMGSQDALRADEYLNWGRLRGVAKLLLAIDGIGTKDETVWRILPEVHKDGDPVATWQKLVARPLQICKTWAAYTLDAALDDDFDGGDLDKARALVRFGELRAVDKIRIATNQAGTDEALLFEGLREATRTTIRAEYKKEYGEDLDELLFGKGTFSVGELSGEDRAYAKTLLDVDADDPDRLVQLVQVAAKGAGTNTTMIWDAINDAIKRRDQEPKPDKVKEIAAAKKQLENLAAKVKDENDPLDLKGLWGDLSSDDHARLRALLGIAETGKDDPGGSTLTVEILNDPVVQRLRGMGGIEVDDAAEALMKADPRTTASFVPAWDTKASPLRQYLLHDLHDALDGSEQERAFRTILKGSLYERLRFCAGGLWRDDYEDYAINLLHRHAKADERRALRKALSEIEKGGKAADADAGSVIGALKGAFSTGEMDKVRNELQQDTIDVLDRAAELEDDVKREGTDEATDDERRQMAADLNQAGGDGKLTPAEEARIRASQEKVAGALQVHVQLREEFVGYASQAASFAVGVIVTAGTGGAAGPAIMAALVRAAVASAMARVITEKTLRGDKFDLVGGDGARAFIGGAVDGAMNVVGAAVAAKAMGAVAGAAVREAIQQGTASLGTKLAAGAIEGGVAGAASGTVEAATDEQTWKEGVAIGLGNVFIAAIKAAGLGAGLAVGITAAHGGLARVFGDGHPLVARAKAGDDAAIRELMPQLGERWEVIIADLTNGTGKVAAMSQAERFALRDAMVKHRQKLIDKLAQDFGARPAAGASTEAGSDVDLNVMGETAGQKLLDARAYLDKEYGEHWQQHYRMALLIDANRVGTVNEFIAALDPTLRAQIEGQITRTGELYALARRARGAPVEERAALLDKVSGQDRARVQHLVDMDDAARLAAHDQALLDGDSAMQRLRAETNAQEKARLATEVTERQMLANMLNDDAYITPGGVGRFAGGKGKLNAAQLYQAAVDQVDMIGHQVHVNHGVLKAMRSYEIFKYMQRFCDLVADSGLAVGEDLARLTFFRNWTEYVYRVEREATASATAGGPRNLASSADKARVRLTDPQAPKPGVSDAFLIDNYREFQTFADKMSGRLRQAGMGDGAPPVGGAPAGGEPAALVTMPRLSAEEAALAPREAPTGQPPTGTNGNGGGAPPGGPGAPPVPFGPAQEQALRQKVQTAVRSRAVVSHTFEQAVEMNLPTEGIGLADVVKGMSPEVRTLYQVAYDGMNNPENWEAVLVNIAREAQGVQGPYSHAEITSNQTQAIWNLSQQATGPDGKIVVTPPANVHHDFVGKGTPFGPRFYDVNIGREHGMSAHMVQDLVVDRAFQRAGVGMKAEQFRARIGTETGAVQGANAKRNVLLWNALYDSQSGFTSPDTVTPLLHDVLGKVD